MNQISPSKHTPGPWAVDDDDLSTVIRANEIKIAEAHSYSGRVRNDNQYYPDAATILANARLIAAAPDLLAALEDYVKWVGSDLFAEHDVYHNRAIKSREVARAAIAKATGAPC